jgi:hypothetical protein
MVRSITRSAEGPTEVIVVVTYNIHISMAALWGSRKGPFI